jgi:hypothetical protein
MSTDRLGRVSWGGRANARTAVAFEDPAESLTHGVLWLCSLVVIACGFARLFV